MSGRLPATLRAYRLLSAAAAPLMPLMLSRRLKRGKEHGGRIAERRGIARMARPQGPLVWLHAASVGELSSVLPLIERLRARGVGVLVTTGTVTSSGLAEQRLPRGAIHQFVPLDVPRFVRRFLDHWQPDLALFVEQDLWPNMIMETSARGVPMILVNARLSENSFRRWTYLRSMIVDLLQRFDLCLAGHARRRRALERAGRAARRQRRQSQARRAGAARRQQEADGAEGRHRHASDDRGGLHPSRRRRRRDRSASAAARQFPRLADADRAASSRARTWRVRARGGGRLEGRAALARRKARCRDRHLCGRHHGRARPDLPPGAGGVHRRLAGQAWRTESDRGGQARRRHSARTACVEFHRDLRCARCRAWRRAGGRCRPARLRPSPPC